MISVSSLCSTSEAVAHKTVVVLNGTEHRLFLHFARHHILCVAQIDRSEITLAPHAAETITMKPCLFSRQLLFYASAPDLALTMKVRNANHSQDSAANNSDLILHAEVVGWPNYRHVGKTGTNLIAFSVMRDIKN
jgi:hypothetical protein